MEKIDVHKDSTSKRELDCLLPQNINSKKKITQEILFDNLTNIIKSNTQNIQKIKEDISNNSHIIITIADCLFESDYKIFSVFERYKQTLFTTSNEFVHFLIDIYLDLVYQKCLMSTKMNPVNDYNKNICQKDPFGFYSRIHIESSKYFNRKIKKGNECYELIKKRLLAYAHSVITDIPEDYFPKIFDFIDARLEHNLREEGDYGRMKVASDGLREHYFTTNRETCEGYYWDRDKLLWLPLDMSTLVKGVMEELREKVASVLSSYMSYNSQRKPTFYNKDILITFRKQIADNIKTFEELRIKVSDINYTKTLAYLVKVELYDPDRLSLMNRFQTSFPSKEKNDTLSKLIKESYEEYKSKKDYKVSGPVFVKKFQECREINWTPWPEPEGFL